MYRKGCVLGWSVCDPPKNTNPFICTTFTPLNHTRTIVSITTYGKSENRGKKKEGGENLNECRRALTFIYTRLLLLLNITHTLTTTISNSTLFQFYIFILLVCDLFECAISPLPSTFSRLFIWTRQLAIHTFLKFKFRLIFAVHIEKQQTNTRNYIFNIHYFKQTFIETTRERENTRHHHSNINLLFNAIIATN